MRILFVLDRVENPASANAQLACRLAEQLLAQGHEIHLLELWDGENPPPAPPAGASQHTLAFADERLMNHALENGAKAMADYRAVLETERMKQQTTTDEAVLLAARETYRKKKSI